MAVYGDMLSAFPELFRMYKYYTMKPKPVASYTERELLGAYRGVLQTLKRGELGVENYTLQDTEVPTLWTKVKLQKGNFVEFEDETYRIVNDMSWKFEGGFYVYELNTLAGNTDKQEAHEYIDYGTFN